ncbi:glycosyl hydrolase family 5 protein-like protein/cellulase [Boeremia exigua]|uniref:glycosyl hydrolase family 5 protein-like protein/cellulase n=1 Tax=Boeremia exigua TaxID=749465 RepID=UPI001E8D2E3A|nr:glycosyl hydrolase family 5 protein-like protein/cellulase [Boeremia exigua]KAH6639824.1 glycosyl hydrolase family 5 protein-like protein/cellulase [Boeremia exigua]
MRVLSLLCAVLPAIVSAFPNAPFVTEGQWVHDNTGENFTYVGVNWPGAGEVMIPEGLQYRSVASIAAMIKSLNMNVVRLTFAIEMLDDIVDNGGDVTLQNAFKKALGDANGTTIYNQVIKNNPQFGPSTTRLQVYDNIAAELAKLEIYVHLDNHMSNGAWCCSTTDGNAWFGDRNFDVAKWKRGLEYMAKHSKQWPNMVSIGLRNEFRKPDVAGSSLPYDWPTWYEQNVDAANIVNAANPDILIFFSGLNYDTTLQPIPWADDLGNGQKFLLTDFAYADKLVLEMHNHQNSATDCGSIESGLWNNGFRATGERAVNRMPVLLTEFGFSQADGSYQGVYASCLRKLMPQWRTGWMVWALGGSYYIRSGIQDYEETWGLTNHDWTGWRNEAAIAELKGMVDATLASVQ